MSIKRIIVNRVIALYLLTFLGAVLIIARILQLQFVQGEELEQKAEDETYRYVSITPNRGDIYSHKGRHLLATSVPYYEVRMDLVSDALTREVFEQGVDSLAWHLSRMFGDKSKSAYKNMLNRARQEGKRYFLIQRQVSYRQLQEMRTFPIFRLGRYKGGFIVIQNNIRIRPHNILAARTIGNLNKGESGNVVGIEGAYDHYLKGVVGYRLMQKTAGNLWIPLSDANEIDPQDGYDIITTIDIDIQDVAENALNEQLKRHNAHHGCAVLMEVATGEIRAIANLERTEDGSYWETYNYAIAESTEPGSTFKLASLITALEDGYVDLGDTIDTEDGTVQFYDITIRDTRKGGYGKITLERAFQVSSNVGISKTIHQYYNGRETEFVDRLYRMHLNEPLGLEIRGEGKPLIRYPDDPYWSGISLVMMSHGYEVQMTPLQVLCLYNAIANNGKMVKPRFVNSITRHGQTVKRFRTEVIDPSICSPSTLEKMQQMLEGVVDSGTAMNLRNEGFRIAGKTGTAQIANEKYGYRVDSKISYQASFVGYFPAEDPKYSCIVVVNSPSSNVYYGNLVAGPVFREIANKVYASGIEMHNNLYTGRMEMAEIPFSKHGSKPDLDEVSRYLDIPVAGDEGISDWVATRRTDEFIEYRGLDVSSNRVPNVLEMGISDAVFLLESLGLEVRVIGRGKVREQSLPPGTLVRRGDVVTLTMSFQ
jgi:cell division protein FtsI (penicillin-binding protein 3)